MEVKDDRFVGSEKGVEIAVGETMRMFRLRHETEQVYNVNESDLKVSEVLFENLNGRERFHGRDVTSTRQHHVWIFAVIRGSPVPYTNTFSAMSYRLVHVEVLKMILLVSDDDIDVVARAQTMISHAQ